jgi:hypothetical protein
VAVSTLVIVAIGTYFEEGDPSIGKKEIDKVGAIVPFVKGGFQELGLTISRNFQQPVSTYAH